MMPEALEKITKWPVPPNNKELESFLGFINYFREHIEEYSEMSACLFHLMGPRSKFIWEHTLAFDKLKESVYQTPILSFLNDVDEFILDNDASDTLIGAILSQVQNGNEKVIPYKSFVVTP
jgi:hypothetical protein